MKTLSVSHVDFRFQGGYPRLCRETIETHLDDFVPVCEDQDFDACLDAVAETTKIIVPACRKNSSHVKRAILYCTL